MEVSIRMVFLKLGEIDTVRENFQADVYIEAQWKEPALNKCSEEVATIGHVIMAAINGTTVLMPQ